tara:strand:- start:4111 stop:4341 length:231 start_codon:yes stop_codon:yes gene_type:complete
MAVRNSYVKVFADGRKTPVGVGPGAKDGKLDAQFTVRNNGTIEKSVAVYTVVDGDDLCLYVQSPDGEIIYEHKTRR